ncbi:unnamed protein product, partial [Hymenolepis diminuta]
MKPEEAQAIKSLLQLAASEEEFERVAGGTSPSAVISQRDLRDQPVLEEVEEEDEEKEEEEKSSEDKIIQKQLTTIAEGPEETEGAGGDSSKPKVEVEVIIKKPKHHRHYRHRKPRKTLRQHIYHQYALWLKGIRLARSSRSESGHDELQGGGNSDRSDSKSSDESSQVSICD